MTDKIIDIKKRKEGNEDEAWSCSCGCAQFWLLGNGEIQCIRCYKRVAGYWNFDQ